MLLNLMGSRFDCVPHFPVKMESLCDTNDMHTWIPKRLYFLRTSFMWLCRGLSDPSFKWQLYWV